jgi:hypothetical protein
MRAVVLVSFIFFPGNNVVEDKDPFGEVSFGGYCHSIATCVCSWSITQRYRQRRACSAGVARGPPYGR